MARQLWFLRHGEAEPHDARPDEDRRLTARGERQSAAAGQALARLGIEFAACFTSPRVREAIARAGIQLITYRELSAVADTACRVPTA